MASKFTYDTAAKVFILNLGVTSLDLKTEFYSWVKTDWKDDDSLNKFRFPILSIGGQPIGGGQSISPYYSLLYGWKIRPPEEDTEVEILGNIISADESSPFTMTLGTFDTVIKQIVSANSLTTGFDLTGVPADVWTYALEGPEEAQETIRLLRAGVVGKASGGGTLNMKFRDRADSKDRIDAVVTPDGDRTSVTTDPT